MIYFVVNLLLLGMWSFLFRGRLNPRESGSIAFQVIVVVQLACFALLTPETIDVSRYAERAVLGYYQSMEPGWEMFSRLAWSLWPSYHSLIFFSSTLFVISFSVFSWKHSSNLALSWLVLICMGIWGTTLYVLRQTVAMAFLLFAFSSADQKKALTFVMLVLIASMFHQTAIAFLIVYPFVGKQQNSLYFVCMLAISLFILLAGEVVIDFLTSLSDRYADYESNGGSGISYLFMLILIECFIGYVWKRHGSMTGAFHHSFTIGIVVQLLALRLSVLTRLTRYFVLSSTILLPNSLAMIRSKKERLLFSMLIVACLLFLYFYVGDCFFPGGSAVFEPVLPA